MPTPNRWATLYGAWRAYLDSHAGQQPEQISAALNVYDDVLHDPAAREVAMVRHGGHQRITFMGVPVVPDPHLALGEAVAHASMVVGTGQDGSVCATRDAVTVTIPAAEALAAGAVGRNAFIQMIEDRIRAAEQAIARSVSEAMYATPPNRYRQEIMGTFEPEPRRPMSATEQRVRAQYEESRLNGVFEATFRDRQREIENNVARNNAFIQHLTDAQFVAEIPPEAPMARSAKEIRELNARMEEWERNEAQPGELSLRPEGGGRARRRKVRLLGRLTLLEAPRRLGCTEKELKEWLEIGGWKQHIGSDRYYNEMEA